MDQLSEAIKELEENEGIMKMLRRHRDEAEAKLDEAQELVGQLIEDLEYAIGGYNDEAAMLESLKYYKKRKAEIFENDN